MDGLIGMRMKFVLCAVTCRELIRAEICVCYLTDKSPHIPQPNLNLLFSRFDLSQIFTQRFLDSITALENTVISQTVS